MGAKLREYRRRIKSVGSTKKITKAMELIAASRIVKAQQRIEAARPYAEAITGVVSADALMEAFTTGSDGGGVDEIHVVYTEFTSIAVQRATAKRMLPLVVEYTDDEPAQQAQYEFEPSAEGVLDALLPRYVEARVYA